MYGMSFFLHSKHEGLPANICILVKNGSTEPRIMIQRNKNAELQVDDAFCMTISDSPEVMGEVGRNLTAIELTYFVKFILKNKKVLLDYWTENVDSSELVEKIIF